VRSPQGTVRLVINQSNTRGNAAHRSQTADGTTGRPTSGVASPRVGGAALKEGLGETVGGIVLMLRGENSRDVVRRVEEKVAEINASSVLPSGLASRAATAVERAMRSGRLIACDVVWAVVRGEPVNAEA